jgi:hypothetical protein
MRCHFCGADSGDGKIYRNSLCESCGRELKICRNCRFYEPGAQWDCRETINEPVRDKEAANFCDYFVPSDDSPGGTVDPKKNNARENFENLFGT